MKVESNLSKFNRAVKNKVSLDENVYKKIKNSFEEIKGKVDHEGASLMKLSEFAYKTLLDFDNKINIDLAMVKFYPKDGFKFKEFKIKIFDMLKTLSSDFSIDEKENYLAVKTKCANTDITFRIILLVEKKNEHGQIKHFTSRNSIVQEDISLEVTKDMLNANKKSLGVIFSLKRLINYTMKDIFEYHYNIDFIILRWFNEYMCKKIDNYIEQNIYPSKKRIENFDVELFLKNKNYKTWFIRNVDYRELITYILNKLFHVNTFYFSEFNFESEEFFESISRYSLNSNSTLNIPTDYLSGFEIFDLEKYEDVQKIQGKTKKGDSYSKIAFDKSRNYDKRFVVTPIMKSGMANYAMYKRWFVSKANELFSKLSEELKVEIRSTKQREGMETLNKIAHDWLSSYYARLQYLKPYFDFKYPLHTHREPADLIDLILDTIDNIQEEDWLIGYDN